LIHYGHFRFTAGTKPRKFYIQEEIVKHSLRLIQIFACVVLWGALAVFPAHAQTASARIIGNITDPNGAAVPSAKITVVNVATQVHYDTTGNDEGYFQAVDLPIGRYNVTIEAPGFRKVTYENQVLQINQVLRIDVKLEIGAISEVIEVKEQATVVETVNPTLGASVTGRTLTDLPLNGRNVLQLTLLQPGVTPNNPDDTSSGFFNIAGGRSDSVTFLLDGGLNNEQLGNGVVFNPNPDAVAEFRILENNYTAEYGRNGGGIVTEVLKSGTNEWHGSAFEFVRNDAFNANDFFNKNNPANLLPRDVLKRNQYGGTFGGPITLPHLVHGKDKFFFFVDYQGQRETSKVTTSGIVTFTPAQLGGDFSQAAGNGGVDPGVACFLSGLNHNQPNPNNDPTLVDGTQCRQPNPNPTPNGPKTVPGVAHPFFQSDPTKQFNGIIDPTKISGVAQKYIAAGLIATSPNGTLNSQAGNTNNDNELTMKFDFNITQKDRLAVTLGGNRNPKVNGAGSTGLSSFFTQGPGYPQTNIYHNYFSNFAYTHTFSSNVLNEFRVTVQRSHTLQAKPARTIPTHSALGETGITPDLELGGAALAFDDQGTYFGFGIQGPSTLISNTFAYSDTLSWTRGRHNWKFGGAFSAYQFNTAFDFIGNGLFDFVGSGGVGSGNDFADFLLGIPFDYFESPNAPTNARSKFYAGFAQDEWRVNKKLVLTLGVRYEYSSPKLDTHGDTFNVIPGHAQSTVFPNAPSGLVFPGDKNAPRGVNFPDKNNWAPRFGFAWDPKGNSKTSIRGGFGMFYDILKAEDNFQDNGQPPFFSGAGLFFSPIPGNPSADVPYLSQPFVSTGATNPFPSKPVNHSVNFAAAGIFPFGISSIFLDDAHLKTPYTYQYNLSVQREIARNTTVQVGYVGSSSHGLTSLVDINPFPLGTSDRILNLLPGNSSCGATTQFLCSFSNLPEFKNVSKASYNGLTASLTRQLTDARFIGRTYFTLGYTFAHSIDNTSGFRERNSQVPSFTPGLFRAASDFDVRNRITFSGGWDLPIDRMFSSAPKRLTQGWSVYPIFSWRQGFPLDVFAQVDSSGGFTNPGVSGAGDNPGNSVVHANLTGQPLTTFDPHTVQTLTGDLSGTNTGNFYFNPAVFTTAQCGDATHPTVDPVTGAPIPCTPSSTLFPSTAQVVANPALRTYGTLPRNFFRGPGRANLDMTFSKSTAITERLKLEIRADFFNAFNHAEFANPTTNIASSNFGRVTRTGDQEHPSLALPADPKERIIQLGAKISF
jgi:Carboxypeptidase regulatory-like domain/TonB-dependent Receptor Plug Domain/TonB dependent receptor